MISPQRHPDPARIIGDVDIGHPARFAVIPLKLPHLAEAGHKSGHAADDSGLQILDGSNALYENNLLAALFEGALPSCREL